jgi:hypothetical protein
MAAPGPRRTPRRKPGHASAAHQGRTTRAGQGRRPHRPGVGGCASAEPGEGPHAAPGHRAGAARRRAAHRAGAHHAAPRMPRQRARRAMPGGDSRRGGREEAGRATPCRAPGRRCAPRRAGQARHVGRGEAVPSRGHHGRARGGRARAGTSGPGEGLRPWEGEGCVGVVRAEPGGCHGRRDQGRRGGRGRGGRGAHRGEARVDRTSTRRRFWAARASWRGERERSRVGS